MSVLAWRIKDSLLGYVRAMSDGEIRVDGGAAEGDDGAFVFPGDGELRFRGAVTLIGHAGMMRVVLRDPAIERQGAGLVLTVTDPDDDTARLTFATIENMTDAADGTLRATGTSLAADGADLFFGPYREGTPLDDPLVRLA